jgi:hypothetical protein
MRQSVSVLCVSALCQCVALFGRFYATSDYEIDSALPAILPLYFATVAHLSTITISITISITPCVDLKVDSQRARLLSCWPVT